MVQPTTLPWLKSQVIRLVVSKVDKKESPEGIGGKDFCFKDRYEAKKMAS